MICRTVSSLIGYRPSRRCTLTLHTPRPPARGARRVPPRAQPPAPRDARADPGQGQLRGVLWPKGSGQGHPWQRARAPLAGRPHPRGRNRRGAACLRSPRDAAECGGRGKGESLRDVCNPRHFKILHSEMVRASSIAQ